MKPLFDETPAGGGEDLLAAALAELWIGGAHGVLMM
jgi:hypothetical protein